MLQTHASGVEESANHLLHLKITSEFTREKRLLRVQYLDVTVVSSKDLSNTLILETGIRLTQTS